MNNITNQDLKDRVRRIKVLEDFAAKTFLADGEKPKDKEDFYAHCPLDSIVKTPEGNVAYGYINEELASLVGGKEAPVFVTEELYHHLISKQEKRDIEDVRTVVQEAMQRPDAVCDGNGNGSFNIFFSHKEKNMYINLIYCEKPLPCYTVRSAVPTHKINGTVLVQGTDIPSLSDIPASASGLEDKIMSSYGKRVTGMTWNGGNFLKSLRLYSEENKLPTPKEMEDMKTWLAQGDAALMQKQFGLYIKQALEQTHCDKFFQIAKESGALTKFAPEFDAAVDDSFLNMMERVDHKPLKFKQSVILSLLAERTGSMPKQYQLDEGREDAEKFTLYGSSLIKAKPGDVETLWGVVEGITNNFKKPEILNTVQEMCEIRSPELCQTPEFREKMALCSTICERAPELKTAIAASMKSMPRDATKEDRVQAQERIKKEFMQELAKDIRRPSSMTKPFTRGDDY